MNECEFEDASSVKALMVVKAQMNYHVMSPPARAKHNKKNDYLLIIR
jgi:hypothetical protein